MNDGAEERASSPPPVPPLLDPSESSESAALAALAKKQTFFARFKRRSKKTRTTVDSPSSEALQERVPDADAALVDISLSDIDTTGSSSEAFHSDAQVTSTGRGKDVYEWVTLYENQRGWTILSTPYYSSATLLPLDPAAFTVSLPAGSPRAAEHPRTVQDKDQYQLPDPTWKWVSKWWMIDMRSDGAVQWDGFEYNWFFRRGRWRPRVGPLSAGGYVRRRRWVRLMVRPATEAELAQMPAGGSSVAGSSPAGSSAPGLESGEDVWRGDEDDWHRCTLAMKALVRDGRKLEVWRAWLGVVVSHDRRKQWTEDRDDDVNASPFTTLAQDAHPPVRDEWLLAVLKPHARDVLHQFVFPDSRAQFLELLLRADLGGRLASTGIFEDGADFYSRSPSLATIAPSKPSVPRSLEAIADEQEGEDSTAPSRQQSVAQAQDEKDQAAEALNKVQVGTTS